MTTAPALIPHLSMCPVETCGGQLVRCVTAPYWHCNADSLHHAFRDDDLAACTRCTDPQSSDRETVAQALHGDWLVVGNGLICPEHTRLCACGILYDLEAIGACPHNCPDCSGSRCGECHQADAADRAYDAWKERGE